MKNALIAVALIFTGSVGASALLPTTAQAATACDNKGMILTFKPWYYGLTEGSDCKIKSPGDDEAKQRAFISRIVLTIVEDLLQLAAYITIGYMIFGGFTYLTSGGTPDRAAKGMKTVMNAAIGLVVAMAAIGLVNFVGAVIGL